ncbi:MAG: hypothetical protein RJQ21_03980 [Rhodospirillales bacterium]
MSAKAPQELKRIATKDDIPFEPMRPIWQFWHERCPGALPSRNDFRIEEFLPWTAHIGAVRPEGDPPRFKVTLASRVMIELNKIDATNRFFDQYMPPEALEFGCRPYLEAMKARTAVYDRLDADTIARKSFQRLVMPCSNDGSAVDYFIIAIFYDRGFVEPHQQRTLYDHVLGKIPEGNTR